MPGGLLILSFHKPAANNTGTFAEDLLFKQRALASGLIKNDAMDEAGPPDDLLFSLAGVPGSGLEKAAIGTGKPLISFNNVGTAAWQRPPFRQAAGADSRFDDWMRKVLSTPIECLVLAGHHSQGVLWGLEAPGGNTHRPYTMVVPDAAAKTLVVGGHPLGGGTSASVRGGPYDVSVALKTCRLVLIWGCNGAARETKNWRPWHDLVKSCSGGKAPVILGHYKTHLWPRDTEPKRFSDEFWRQLAVLAGASSITKVCEEKHADLIKLWAETMKTTFATSSHCNKHMLFQKKFTRQCQGYGPRGAGGVDPSGAVFHVVNDNGDVKPVN
jgi:hypothetical protein